MPREVRIYYGTDWKGESGWRRIVPLSIGFEKSKWRPVQHWVLHAFDVDRGEEGSFAMQDIKKWEVPCNREALATPSLIPKEGTAAGQ
jgi:predicted DNA-binding transcriptional regulator YafY